MKVYLSVETGIRKSECEDTAIFNENIINNGTLDVDAKELRCVGVADGVGGNAGGRIAGEYIARKLSQASFTEMSETEIRAFVEDINSELINYAATVPDKAEMATTLTGVVAAKQGYYLIHAGNTRLYIMQGSYLKLLTTDHTTYAWLTKRGQYEAAQQCNKSEINCCLGGGNLRYADRLTVDWLFSDCPATLLLTSDGIHEFVDIDYIEEVLTTTESDSEAARLITQKATQNGSADDKTVVILRR